MNNNKHNQVLDNIKTTLHKANKTKVVIGISGGIDSLVCLNMLISTIGRENIYAYYIRMEEFGSIKEIETISNSLEIKIEVLDLTKYWLEMVKEFDIKNKDNIINLKSKIRTMFLTTKAFELNALVVSCLNYSEYYLGYFTKTGDGIGDLFPLINFCKKEVYELANFYNIDQHFIDKKPSADLYENQYDEIDIGVNYDSIDKYLQNIKIDKEVIKKIESWNKKNSHKHTLSNFIFENNNLRKVNDE